MLLRATALGLASCPLSQPLEVTTTRLRLRDEVLGGTASPQVVLRFGWPQWGTPLPITPRRAIDDFVEVMPPTRRHSERPTDEQHLVASPHRPLDFWLKLVDTMINLHYRNMLEEHGIVRRQWEMMRLLSRAPASQEDLDAALAPFLPEDEPGSSAAALSELTDSGWLTQINGGYELTERGRAVHQRLDEVFSQKNEDLADGVSPGDYALAVSVLERVAATSVGGIQRLCHDHRRCRSKSVRIPRPSCWSIPAVSTVTQSAKPSSATVGSFSGSWRN